MDLNSPTVQSCIAGTRAEYQGALEQARTLYQTAWEVAQTPADKCIAAHYIAHLESDVHQALVWNQKSLAFAQEADPDAVAGFLGALYVNLGQSYEQTGQSDQAQHYYALAAKHGVIHQLK